MRIDTIDILKFLGREDTSPELKLSIDRWIAKSDENRKEFEILQFIHSQRITPTVPATFMREGDWTSFVGLVQPEAATQSASSFNLWKASLVLLMLISIGVCSYYFLRSPFIEEGNQNENYARTEIKLPDGTDVILEPNSKLKYKRDFVNDTQRYVILEGQAKFDVVSMPKKPFRVEVDGAAVRVLGTIFTVTKEENSDNATFANIEGLINCYEIVKPKNNITLKQGDKAIWDGKGFDYIPKEVPPPPKPKGENRSIGQILDYLSDEPFETIVEFRPYIDLNEDDEIFIDQDLPLSEYLEQLKSNGSVLYSHLPGGRYSITQLKSK